MTQKRDGDYDKEQDENYDREQDGDCVPCQ